MASIAVVVGSPLKDSYCEALGRAYLRGAEGGGHDVRLLLLADMKFDAVLREGYRCEQPLEPDLVKAREAMKGADHLVFVFPLWCGDMPALMKGFIERILQPDLLAAQHDRTKWKVFSGKSARIVMTMGMPGWFYRWYYGAHALKLFKRNVLHFIGIKPVHATIFGMVEAAGDEKRRVWLREVEAMGHGAE